MQLLNNTGKVWPPHSFPDSKSNATSDNSCEPEPVSRLEVRYHGQARTPGYRAQRSWGTDSEAL